MLKLEEINDPQSCLNKALDYEMLFTLLARDEDAPDTIRYWVMKRLVRGKNKLEDKEIQDALHIAREMERQRPQVRYELKQATGVNDRGSQ